MVRYTGPLTFHPGSESDWLTLINMTCPVRTMYGSRRRSRASVCFYKWYPLSCSKWSWRCNSGAFVQGPEGHSKPAYWKEVVNIQDWDFRSPQIVRSPYHWLPVIYGSSLPFFWGRRWWALHGAPPPLEFEQNYHKDRILKACFQLVVLCTSPLGVFGFYSQACSAWPRRRFG